MLFCNVKPKVKVKTLEYKRSLAWIVIHQELLANHALGNAAKDDMSQARAPVRSHDDQANLFFDRRFDNALKQSPKEYAQLQRTVG